MAMSGVDWLMVALYMIMVLAIGLGSTILEKWHVWKMGEALSNTNDSSRSSAVESERVGDMNEGNGGERQRAGSSQQVSALKLHESYEMHAVTSSGPDHKLIVVPPALICS